MKHDGRYCYESRDQERIRMAQPIPSQCPECGALDIHVAKVSPDAHDRGEEWVTRASCEGCEEYVEWFD
jgi:hypothetical protein